MRYPWSLLILCLSADLAVCQTTVSLEHLSVGLGEAAVKSSATTTAGQNINTTAMTPMLIAQYSMNLTSTDFAVLGSTIIYEAELTPHLRDSEIFSARSDRFIYQWTNTAIRRPVKTIAGLKSNVSLTFPSEDVTAGDYLMTVAAYWQDDPTTIVAFKTRKFTLTQQLNGQLIITQYLDYQRDPNIFSTRKPLTLTAKIQDLFLQSDLSFNYYWYEGGSLFAKTEHPRFVTIFNDPFNASLASLIFILTGDTLKNVPDSSVRSDVLTSETNASAAGPFGSFVGSINGSFWTSSTKQEKGVADGIFERVVDFKDPINSCHVSRLDADPDDRSISLKGTALVNITCAGSVPSTVCVNITDLNSSLPASYACKPRSFFNKLDHLVRIQLTSTGWNDVHFFVYNDVSRYHLIESFYGYSPDVVNVPALTLPFVFGVLGIIVIIIGGVYFLRLRKKPLVEVADFDFHPTLTSSQARGRFQFSRVADTIRSMFSRDQYYTDHTNAPSRKPATNFNGNYSRHFYESL